VVVRVRVRVRVVGLALSDRTTPAEKFRLVMEASALSEAERGEFLRREGLAWRSFFQG
jgi:hypothetical protein